MVTHQERYMRRLRRLHELGRRRNIIRNRLLHEGRNAGRYTFQSIRHMNLIGCGDNDAFRADEASAENGESYRLTHGIISA
jgi:hypothetical protein